MTVATELAVVPSVLVIDDAPDIQHPVDARRRAEGAQILHALDAEAGLALARERPPTSAST